MSNGEEIGRALQSVRAADFAPSNLVGIPCFRDAGLAGFACLFVFSTVTFAFHGSPRRAANFGVGGFLLGAVFAWEQCNARRRHEKGAIDAARERYAAGRASTT